jgi:hypothetical protein
MVRRASLDTSVNHNARAAVIDGGDVDDSSVDGASDDSGLDDDDRRVRADSC